MLLDILAQEGQMDYELITVETEEGVRIVSLNRLEKLNAMNNQLNAGLCAAVKRLKANHEICA